MESIITTFHPRHDLEESKQDLYRCILCEEVIYFKSKSYYCTTCKFHFPEECTITLMESGLTINRPGTHMHTLTFIRQRNAFRCDACGEIGEHKMNMYGCLICNFFVHRNCIYLPKVIKITRHSHRLIHTLQIPDDGYMSCQVCYRDLVCAYGGYMCTNETCVYKVHSHCATNKKVWDGKDVEGEPEEVVTPEDVGSWSLMEELDGKTIRHFSHHHDLMRLEDEDEEGRRCQACIRPIDFDSFLGCKQCDFALHDTCASLPRKLEHVLHRHSLTLLVDIVNIDERFFTCSICERESIGFMYQCTREECEFKMDTKCASIVEPFNHVSHQHPLYISHIPYDMIVECDFCSDFISTGATCYQCRNFHLDFKCATLLGLVRCNYGNHPLNLSYYEDKCLLWCDICEEELNPMQLFYTCRGCNIAQHIHCVIGRYPFLKHGHTIKVNGLEVEIASNRHLSRPICSKCHCICQDKLLFIDKKEGVTFCSINCNNSPTKAPTKVDGNLRIAEYLKNRLVYD